MRRTEEQALIRAVLEIGRKVSALSVDATRAPGMFRDAGDEHDLLAALQPLRKIVDGYDAARQRRGRR